MIAAPTTKPRAAGRRPSRPAPQRRLALLAVAAAVAATTPTSVSAAAASPIVEMVLDAIDANYAAVESARLTYVEELRDAEVDEPTETRRDTPHGGVVVITRTPVRRARLEVWLEADQLRVDRLQGEAGGSRQASFVFRENQCTQYVEGHQAAWVRRRGEMPGMLPLDPRHYGSGDIRRELRRVFLEEQIVEGAVRRDEGGEALVRIVTQSSGGVRTTYEFKESAGYLPTRRLTHWPDGSVLRVIDVEYRSVAGGAARMPEAMTQRFYAEGVAQTPGSPAWRQQLKREVTGQIVVNQKIPAEAFELQMPQGVRVSDNLRQAVYSVTAPLAERTGDGGSIWVTVLVTLALLTAVLYKHLPTIRPRAYS